MKKFFKYKIILWDFDGVILDSMPIREFGFRKVLEEFPREKVELLLEYHRNNGGLSRYIKFQYFFEEILNVKVSKSDIDKIANHFSETVTPKLMDKALLIQDTMTFIEGNFDRYDMHIVSASDEKELKEICTSLEIDDFFKSIQGSPTTKKELVNLLMNKYGYSEYQTVLIGDSFNDYEAAKTNKIDFYGYNNLDLVQLGNYIYKFETSLIS